jgi:hypothetical protein
VNMMITSVPSARRLISSLRDLGYSFCDAVAEMVDNSIEAKANVIQVNFVLDQGDSFLVVLDNGHGMSASTIREALRFGSVREYSTDDLGKFGLGLKTASLSQADRLTVSSRIGESRARINSFKWDMAHIQKSDRWEIQVVQQQDLVQMVKDHLQSTIGTAVTWQGLSRLTNYQVPNSRRAEQEVKRLSAELEFYLGGIFHRQINGETQGRKVALFVNGRKVEPWDPFCRSEINTTHLEDFSVNVTHNGGQHSINFRSFILPTQDRFSSISAHVRAGGLKKWNKQQGFYIYRSGRLLQSGGWCGLRTSDEHMKLARVSVDIPSSLDEIFKVNISKMKIIFPSEIKEEVLAKLQNTFKSADQAYRREKSEEEIFSEDILEGKVSDNLEAILSQIDLNEQTSALGFLQVVPKLLSLATPNERRTIIRVMKKLINSQNEELEVRKIEEAA